MNSTGDYDFDFQDALLEDPDICWLQWLDELECFDFACELAGAFLSIGAEHLDWDFAWIHRSWKRYSEFFRDERGVAAVQRLHRGQIAFGLRPEWKQYGPFGIAADILQLKSKEEPVDRLYLGEVVGDDYQIEHRISDGGFGIVYRAMRLSDEKTVAIKVPQLKYDASQAESACQQIHTEANVLQAVAGPGIPEFYDSLEHAGMPVLAIEFIDGILLINLPIATERQKRQIAAYLASACDVLDQLHIKGLLHHDIKPDNIMVDKSGKVYLIDFGLALCEEDLIERAASQGGTPDYMSPERLKYTSAPIDWRSDLWSIGVMLLCVFTDAPLQSLSEGSAHEICIASAKVLPEWLRETGIGRVISKALNETPQDRYGTGRSLRKDLLKWLQDDESVFSSEEHMDAFYLWLGITLAGVRQTLDIARHFAEQSLEMFEGGEDPDTAVLHLQLAKGGCAVAPLALRHWTALLRFSEDAIHLLDVARPSRIDEDNTPDGARTLLQAIAAMSNAVAFLVAKVNEETKDHGQRTNSRYTFAWTFALAAKRLASPTTQELEELAKASCYPEWVWRDPVGKLGAAIEKYSGDTELARLSLRANRYLLFEEIANEEMR